MSGRVCSGVSLDVRCCWLDLRARDLEAGALGGRTVLGAGMVQDGRSVRWSGSAFVFEGLTGLTGLTTHFARTLVRICSNDIWKRRNTLSQVLVHGSQFVCLIN